MKDLFKVSVLKRSFQTN